MSSLNPTRTVLEQVTEAARLGGRSPGEAAEAAVAMLSRVGIEPERHTSFPHELSGGQRQRVVIAMAVVNGPDLVIADEPTSGLDVITQRELVSLLQSLRADLDVDVVLISHDLPLVSSCCDDVAVMASGRVVERGPVASVIAEPEAVATRELVLAFPRLGERFDEPTAPGSDGRGAGRATGSASAALRLRGVSVTYEAQRSSEPVVAVDGIDLTVGLGERVALVGRSGAGKSTLAKVASGLVDVSSGAVEVLGADIGSLSRAERRALRRRIQTVFQDPYDSLHPGMTVERIVAEPLVVAGVERDRHCELVATALESLGLAPASEFLGRFTGSLSGGQRQRVALARTLVAEPELILADEPTSMLDATLRKTVARQLLTVQADLGASLVFITHDLALAGMVADRIVVVSDGRIVEDGPSQRVLAEPQHTETQRLLAAVAELDHRRVGVVSGD